MQLSPALIKFLEKENKRYCRQLSISPVPKLIYTKEDVLQEDSSLKRFRLKQKYGLSSFNSKERMTYLNIEKHENAGELIDTLAHELLHIQTDGKMEHSKKFDRLVDRIIIGDYP